MTNEKSYNRKLEKMKSCWWKKQKEGKIRLKKREDWIWNEEKIQVVEKFNFRNIY